MVSIIIVNYKVKEKLLKCIESIYASRPKIDFEIIVVDNDDKARIKGELIRKFPKVKYIKSPKNIGYGAGNNLGFKYAKGEYLFILNPDTQIFSNTLDELVNFLTKNKKVGIVSPLLVDKNGEPFKLQGTSELTPLKGIMCLSFLGKLFSNSRFSREYWLKDWNHTKLKEVSVCPGTALMISRELFKRIGGFDEKFFLYFEEDDLSKRIKSLGYKIFINPRSKIFHAVGESTKQLESAEHIFATSRFYYFRKHFGILKALLVESFLSINKLSLSLLLILCLAVLLRIYNLENGMVFIGDQGWFYLSARDMLLSGKIPLVGITSSHAWLHQGPLWTYMLAATLWLSKFNPIAGAYLTIGFGVAATFLMYWLGRIMFSKKVGLIAALLYAASPLIVFFDRMAFDPSPIPFFTILYFFALYKWLKGSIKFFPLMLMLLAVLYNLELATFALAFLPVLLFVFGFWKKKSWVTNLMSKRIIFYSLLFPTTIMLPIIIYDFSHGFKQTVVFLGWIFYKPFSFLIKQSDVNLSTSLPAVINFLGATLQKLVFYQSLILSLVIFTLAIVVLIFEIKKTHSLSKILLLLLLLISLGGILVNQTPSDAYLPIIFPFVIFAVAIAFEFLSKVRILKYAAILLLFLMLSVNVYAIYKNDSTNEFQIRLDKVAQIIKLSNNQPFNLVSKGDRSEFASFTMNYEYLLWWKGHPVATQNVRNKIVVWESSKGIIIYKQ